MTRYVLFAGEHFYAKGGWNDAMGEFDSLEEAVAKAHWLLTEDIPADRPALDWWHVVDMETRSVVAGSYYQAHSAPDYEDGEKRE